MFKKLLSKSSSQNNQENIKPENSVTQNFSQESEKLLFSIKKQEDALDEKIDNGLKSIDILQQNVKQLIQKGQKKQASYKLLEIKQIEKQIERIDNQKTVFLKLRFQLANSQDNLISADILSKATKVLKQQETDMEQLTETMETLQEMDENQQEIDRIIQGYLPNMDDLEEEVERIAQEEMQINNVPKIDKKVNSNNQKNINSKQINQNVQSNSDQQFQKQLLEQLLI